MSRAEISRVSGPFISAKSITHAFLDYFDGTTTFTGTDFAIDLGFDALVRDHGDHEIAKAVDSFDRHISELLLVGLIDNFQTYLSDLLQLIFSNKPEVLSGGSIKNSIVFQAASLDDIKKYIVDKQVLDLGYKNIEETDAFFKEKFRFNLTDTRLELLRLTRLIQIRNIISHNRGVVNPIFKKNIGAKVDKVGSKVILPNLHAVDAYLIRLAQKIDSKAIAKFDLPNLSK